MHGTGTGSPSAEAPFQHRQSGKGLKLVAERGILLQSSVFDAGESIQDTIVGIVAA